MEEKLPKTDCVSIVDTECVKRFCPRSQLTILFIYLISLTYSAHSPNWPNSHKSHTA